MNTLAALMVLVACHPQTTTCLEEPVAVISYDTSAGCRAALPREMEKARRMAGLIYGDCVPVDPELLAGREIRRAIDPAKLLALDTGAQGKVSAKAFVPEMPVEKNPMRGPRLPQRYEETR
ncbi:MULTISPECIES: hypothetical protein [Alphaproteobacteria]|uniref:Uncharacterized protein n=2 Tax=Alphaproteobacteria TaxID=28211 RepID=A0A512HL83_9HYPH|nr:MULTISPECIES: hypothetical protein [Alphaproteobacteria]GEO86201.1 hypothetical protein RNA01_31330 [Ciceribacter naphthalenivorans]GLR21421.1 hypothetical protein GCM10007920_12070 [Ciceribacter naphthalenivorans]GLT04277.1 hypothetical protein GCM10007926_12070 [Sphingomonas psychrolutea]